MPLSFEKLIKFDLLEKIQDEEPNKYLFKLIPHLASIDSIDSFIKDIPSFPGSTAKISRGEMVQAIGSTLSIEGILIDKEEIEDSLNKAKSQETLERKEQEVENSRRVYEFIIELVNNNEEDKFVYEGSMIRQIHSLFTDKLNYPSNTPGEYRSNFQTTFGEPRHFGLCQTQSEIEMAMKNFVEWLNKDYAISIESVYPLTKAIMAHYCLTEIHPFGDGNGRTARAVEALVLYVSGINSYCFWSLANFWSMNKSEYIKNLGDISNTCDPYYFISWGVKGYLEEVKRIKDKVLKKLKQLMLADYTKYLLANKEKFTIKINKRIVDIIELLIISEPVKMSDFYKSLTVNALYSNSSTTTKYRDLKKMIDLELVNIYEKETTDYIEPNYKKLEEVSYNV